MTTFPEISDVPELDTATMVEVDILMMEDFGISLVQMMENAGRGLAILTRELALEGGAHGKSVTILAGPGGNGGGALTAARRLANWGAEINVCLTHPLAKMSPVPRLQLDILSKLDHVSVLEAGTYPTLADAVLDGLIGYSLSGSPKGIAADLIHWANGQPAPILSLDVPSGFDATRGIIRNPAIQATATLTIALPKICQSSPDLAAHMGDLYCIDIGVPPSLYARLDPPLIIPPMFGASDIIRVK